MQLEGDYIVVFGKLTQSWQWMSRQQSEKIPIQFSLRDVINLAKSVTGHIRLTDAVLWEGFTSVKTRLVFAGTIYIKLVSRYQFGS